MADFVPGFEIQELTGEQRRLSLLGRALPYQSYELEGSMRAEVTWYPGNPIATIQLLGAEEKPTTVKGMWKDRFLGSVTPDGQPVEPTAVALWQGAQVASTRALVAAVEQLRLSGQLLEVTWGETVRSGILTRFKQTWPRFEECEWEMEFTWISRGEQPQPTSAPPSTQAPQDFAGEVSVAVQAMRADIEEPDVATFADIIGDLLAAIDRLESQVQEIQDAVQNGVDQVLSPLQVMRRAIGAVNRMKQAAADIVDTCANVPAQFVEEGGGAYTDFGAALNCDAFLRAFQENARAVQLACAEQDEALRASATATSVTDVFIASQDMDLRNVSVQYYGTQDQWTYLKAYNGLDSSKLTAGTVVLIPVLSYGEEA